MAQFPILGEDMNDNPVKQRYGALIEALAEIAWLTTGAREPERASDAFRRAVMGVFYLHGLFTLFDDGSRSAGADVFRLSPTEVIDGVHIHRPLPEWNWHWRVTFTSTGPQVHELQPDEGWFANHNKERAA